MGDEINLKIVFYGSRSVGKTCLFEHLQGNKFGDTCTTVGMKIISKEMEVSGQKVKLRIFDTAGEEKFQSHLRLYFRDAAGIIFVYDVTNKQTFDNIKSYTELDFEESSVRVLVGNKVDLETREVSEEEGIKLADSISASYIECSAKTGHNVNEMLEELVKKILEKPNLIKKKESDRFQIADTQPGISQRFNNCFQSFKNLFGKN